MFIFAFKWSQNYANNEMPYGFNVGLIIPLDGITFFLHFEVFINISEWANELMFI